jgi:hypothetical protein
MLLRTLSMLCLVASFAPASSMAAERYAALECQKDRLFVVVNFFRDYQYRLSWGIDDVLHGDNIEVTRHNWGVIETFASPKVKLDLPVSRGGEDQKPRPGILYTEEPVPQIWETLQCVMLEAD